MDRPAYGMMTDPSRDVVGEIASARKMGFDYVELGIEPPEGHPDRISKRRGEIRAALRAFGHPPVGHTTYWFELWSAYEEVRRAWVGVASKSVDVAAMVGCRKLNIHAPLFHGMYRSSKDCRRQVLDNAVRSLREIARHASGRGVKIVLENMPDPKVTGFREFSYIIGRVPGIGVHVDTGHCFVEGGMPMVSRYLRTFRNRLEHIHFSDNLGLSDDHMGIGRGVIDHYRIMRLLRRIGYGKTITLEVFSGRKDLMDSLRAVRLIGDDIWRG